jgi:hypothetical protein
MTMTLSKFVDPPNDGHKARSGRDCSDPKRMQTLMNLDEEPSATSMLSEHGFKLFQTLQTCRRRLATIAHRIFYQAFDIMPGMGCLSVTCAQGENGKSISPTDSAQSTMARGADTDSDLARPPDGNHPSSRHATPGIIHWSATRWRTAGHVVAHPGSRDSE